MAKDKFLRKKLEKIEINSPFNCVRIDEILKFNQMQMIFKDLLYDPSYQVALVAEAMKPSRVVKVCKDGQNLKRRTPF